MGNRPGRGRRVPGPTRQERSGRHARDSFRGCPSSGLAGRVPPGTQPEGPAAPGGRYWHPPGRWCPPQGPNEARGEARTVTLPPGSGLLHCCFSGFGRTHFPETSAQTRRCRSQLP